MYPLFILITKGLPFLQSDSARPSNILTRFLLRYVSFASLATSISLFFLSCSIFFPCSFLSLSLSFSISILSLWSLSSAAFRTFTSSANRARSSVSRCKRLSYSALIFASVSLNKIASLSLLIYAPHSCATHTFLCFLQFQFWIVPQIQV